jgi:predicted methyltransferase
MVAGVGYLLTVLEPILKARGIQVLHSFSERRSTEFTNEAGEVIKTMAFVHIGWVKT